MQVKAAMGDTTSQPIIVVDLDGTLIRTDLLIESFVDMLKQNPFLLFIAFFWLLKGKAYFKARIASKANVAIATLPYNKSLLRYLRKQKNSGHTLVLATASDEKFAHAVAQHIGIFDHVLASANGINLAGQNKLNAIRQLTGKRAFIYAGDAPTDLVIWQAAAGAILVNLPLRLARQVSTLCPVVAKFYDGANRWRHIAKAMRLHQWLKNLLVFVPMLTAHIGGLLTTTQAAIGFLAFSLCASSVYLLNDLMDLNADRSHRTKRRRPFASGRLQPIVGLLLAPFLLVVAFSLTILLPVKFFFALTLYYVTTLAYTFHVKNLLMLDVLTLAALYTLRIIAGAAAVNVEPSFWLLAFSMFIFLSLAIIKRCSEVYELAAGGKTHVVGRKYQHGDYSILSNLGAASGFIAVLVMALYINSPVVIELYAHPKFLWLLCPLLLYWQGRLWITTGRGRMHDDPIVFTLRDRPSWVIGVFALSAVWLAK